MEPMETVVEVIPQTLGRAPQDRKTRIRVLSSYIKTLRVEESQGKLRLTKLLEELIIVENATQRVWDSAVVVHNLRQRFNREMLVRVLRAEILVEHNTHIRHKQSRSLLSHAVHTSAESRLHESEQGYLHRKRQMHNSYIDQCMSEVNKRLDVFDEKQQRWRNVQVLECRLKWIENGTSPQMTHVVQEYDDQNAPVGSVYECNLFGMRYFLSAIQSFDESAKLSYQNRLEWEECIESLRSKGAERITRMEAELKIAREKGEVELRRQYATEWDEVREATRLEGEAYCSSAPAKAVLAAELNQVEFDIRRGTLSIKEEGSEMGANTRTATGAGAGVVMSAPGGLSARLGGRGKARQRAMDIARRRVIDRRIRGKKKEFDGAFAARVKALEKALDVKGRDIEVMRRTVIKRVESLLRRYSNTSSRKRVVVSM